MAEGNGDAVVKKEEPETTEGRSPDFQKLIDLGLNEKVAVKLDEIYKTGEVKCLPTFLAIGRGIFQTFGESTYNFIIA